LGSSPFARHYSGNTCLFLTLLRCFSSGGALPASMNSRRGITPYRVMGCPIRRSSDLRSVCTSPTLFAAAHVLLRHSTPRHPPHATRPSSSRPPSRQPGEKAPGCRCLVHAVVITLHHSAAIEGNSRMDASLWYDPPLALLVTDPGADRTGTRRVVSSTVKVHQTTAAVPGPVRLSLLQVSRDTPVSQRPAPPAAFEYTEAAPPWQKRCPVSSPTRRCD
jgi:hypothetical protein